MTIIITGIMMTMTRLMNRLLLVKSLLALSKRCFLEGLHVEGSDDHHAGQVFTRHQVEPVNQALDDLEFGQGDGKYGQDQAEQNDDCQCNDPPHIGAFTDCSDHATDPNDGCIENHAHHHDDDHLDLGDIVRRAGDQRGGGELVKLCAGKAFDPLEHIPAQSHAPTQLRFEPTDSQQGLYRFQKARLRAASAYRCE